MTAPSRSSRRTASAAASAPAAAASDLAPGDLDRRPSRRWRTADIVAASVLAVAIGVLFWAWGLAWSVLSVPLTATPGFVAVLGGPWLLAGVVGALVVRKPGAALFTELVAAFVSMVLGAQWGITTMLSGLTQGLGIELVFAALLYRRFGPVAALLAGAGGGIALAATDLVVSYPGSDLPFALGYTLSSIVSGALLAGLLGWLIVRALARAGALRGFAAGRAGGEASRASVRP